ncbi:MAG: DUF4424 domain-containing protein [Alphaproteobacteria bacterium]
MWIRITAFVFLSLAAIAPALANDSMGYLAAGGLVLTPTTDVEMRAEDLYVSEKEIRVRYRFFNNSSTDITTLVAFPMPDLPPLQDNEYALPLDDPVNFMAFETTVDGKPVTNGFEQHAVLNGTDHTALLKSLNIPLSPAYEGTQKALKALNSEQRAKLAAAGLIHEEEGDFGKGWVKYPVPNWTLKTVFHWEQVFPGKKELIVEHRYKPFVGGNVGFLIGTDGKFNKEILAEYKKRYCTDSDFLAAVRRTKEADGPNKLIGETQLEYVLVTGANWAGPIKDFRLVVDKGKPDNLVSFCATGVKKIAPTQFEVRYKDYTPDRNLQVLIMHRPD